MLPGLKQFAIGLTIIAGGSIGLGDEKQASLYSDVQTRTVFSVAGQMTAESTNSRRVASLEQLKRLLTDGGFESTSEQGAVSFSKALGPWKFPFSVSISDDETTLEIILALSNADAKNVTLERLLALMEANRKQAPSQFVYNASQTRIELYRPLKNENISGQLLRDQINAMAIQAKESDSLWKGEPLHANIAAVSYSAETNVAVLSGATSSSADSTAPAPPPKSAVTDLPSSASENGAAKHAASQLIGRWSASRSLGNAFALMFDLNFK